MLQCSKRCKQRERGALGAQNTRSKTDEPRVLRFRCRNFFCCQSAFWSDGQRDVAISMLERSLERPRLRAFVRDEQHALSDRCERVVPA